MNLDFKDIIILVEALIIIVGMFGLYKSIPPEFARLLMDYLGRKAAETPETFDDKFVAEINRIVEALLAAKKETVTIPTTIPGIPSAPPSEAVTRAATVSSVLPVPESMLGQVG